MENITIRISGELKKKLEEQAKKEQRSLSAMVRVILERSINVKT